jgi:hypothetical protein
MVCARRMRNFALNFAFHVIQGTISRHPLLGEIANLNDRH